MVYLVGVIMLVAAQAVAVDGKFLRDVTVSASSEFSATSGAADNLVNGSGITEIADGLGSQQASHAVGSIANLWDTAGGTAFPHTLTFNFHGQKNLDKILVWNGNEGSGNSDRGAKDVLIEYSLDGTNWSTLGNYVFAQAADGAAINATDEIDAGGVLASQVRFTITSNYTDPTYTAMSEVRFYEAEEADDWIPIGDNPGIGSNSFLVADPIRTFAHQNLVNKRGMNESVAGSRGGAADAGGAYKVWDSSTNLTTATIGFRFERDIPLKDVLIWNTNENGQADRGVTEIEIRYAKTGDADYTVLGHYNVALANNDGTTSSYNTQIDLTGLYASVVQIEVLSHNSDPQYSSLAEVRFYGNYEPSFIQNVEARCTQGYFGGLSAMNLVNDSGMFYDTALAGSKTETHVDSTGARWMSSPGNATGDIVFDLGEVETLKEMVVWNNNSSAGTEVDRDVKDVIVNYKLNEGDSWTQLGTYTLNQSNFTVEADPVPAANTIDFGGIDARYVQIDIQSTYGAAYAALAEVRFYRDFSPADPTDVAVNGITATSMNWSWTDNAAEEDNYHVYFGQGATAPATSITIAADSTTYNATGLTPNTEYAFQVAASKFGDLSNKTATVNARTLAAKPAAPQVTNQQPNSFDVAISADTNPAGTEYAIRVVDSGGAGGDEWLQTDGTLGAAEAWQSRSVWGTLTVTGLTEGSNYDVTAKARNGDGAETAESSPTNASTGVNLPAAPTALSATTAATDSLTWEWTDNATNEEGYKVFFGVGDTTSATAVTVLAADSGSYTTNSLAANTQYSLQVAATNAGGDSAKTPAATTYTLALAPVAPSVAQVTTASLSISVGADGNPDYTQYAIQLEGDTTQWVQAGGTLGATPAWQTAAEWDGIIVDGLSAGVVYLVRAQAKNESLIETAFSANAQITLLPSARAQSVWSLLE